MFSTLKIIDISTVLAGPSVGTFFAELGASVLKIESPIHGDVTRSWKLPTEDKNVTISAYFSAINYLKDYIKLDFSIQEDRQKLLHLIKEADILLSNFKFGDAKKFNLEDEVLFELNPKLIHGKISGFGKHSDRVAYDLILQAESGFMSMNGTTDSGPVKMPVALIDVLAAHHLKEGILVALLERHESQNGKAVEVSLYEAAIASLANQATNYLMGGSVAKRIGSLHPNIAPYGELFTTKDQQQITFAIGSDIHFEKLCTFLSLDSLPKDVLYANNTARVKNRIELASCLQEKIQNITAQEILTYMHAHFVPVGKIKSLDEVLTDDNCQHLIREEIIDGIMTKRITSKIF